MGDILDQLTNTIRGADAARREREASARELQQVAQREYEEEHPTPDMLRRRQQAAQVAAENEQQGKGMQELLARTNQTGQALRLRAAGIDPSEVDTSQTA